MKPTPDTRFSLLEKIRRPGDVDAWTEFAAIYQPLIVNICLKKGLQHADANDIAQEVLTRVSDRIESFDHRKTGSTFRGWLYCITRNLTVDFFRRQKKNPLAQHPVAMDFESLPEAGDEESREFEQAFQQQMFLVVAQIVESQVQRQTWDAFWRVEIERRSPQAVAKELGISRGAVYVAKSRVIARLKKEVQKRTTETGTIFTGINHDLRNQR